MQHKLAGSLVHCMGVVTERQFYGYLGITFFSFGGATPVYPPSIVVYVERSQAFG
jgi:hypothetical protein